MSQILSRALDAERRRECAEWDAKLKRPDPIRSAPYLWPSVPWRESTRRPVETRRTGPRASRFGDLHA